MNIAILARGLPPGPVVGGGRLQALGWARHLARHHQVTVLTPLDSTGPAQVAQRDGFTVVRCGLNWEPTFWAPAYWQPHRLWRYAADIRGLRRCLAGIRPPPDVLLCLGTLAMGFAGVMVGARIGVPVVVWILGEGDYRLRGSIVRRTICPRVWQRAAAVLVQTDTNRADLLGALRHVAPQQAAALHNKLFVVGNGLDVPEVVKRNPDGPVLSLGRLVRDKGMDVVIDACVAADRPLVIAGSGPERRALERRASDLAGDVRFTGFVEGEELVGLYRQASAVVLASLHEGLPNVVLEGMAHGRPVVATPVGGIPSVIQHGVNGLLVPVRDAAALAAALRALASDSAMADRLAAAGRAAAAHFEWDCMRPRLEAVLASVSHQECAGVRDWTRL